MEITTAFADTSLEQDGAWVDYRGARIKIARLGNQRFNREFQKMRAPYQDQIRRGRLDTEIELDILCRAYARTILLDWEGFTKEGKKLPYSEDEASRLLKMSLDFRNEITDLATDQANFKIEHDEESEGNS